MMPNEGLHIDGMWKRGLLEMSQLAVKWLLLLFAANTSNPVLLLLLLETVLLRFSPCVHLFSLHLSPVLINNHIDSHACPLM